MGILKELSKVLTLSYPKYRVVVFSLVLILLAVLPIKIVSITHRFSICSLLLKKFCFSEGITRGVSSLLKGNIQQAIDFNFLSIFVLALIIILIIIDLINIFKDKPFLRIR